MAIDKNALPIEAKDLDNNTVKIRSNGLVLEAFNNFTEKISPEIGVSIDEVLEYFGIKDGKYSTDLVHKAGTYEKFTDELKATVSPEEVAKYNEVIQYNKEKIQRLIQSPMRIIKVLVKDGIKEGQPVGLFDEFMDLLSVATGKDKSNIFMSDFDIWAELFLRILVKKQVTANKSFLLNSLFDKLTSNIPLLNFMKKESSTMLNKA